MTPWVWPRFSALACRLVGLAALLALPVASAWAVSYAFPGALPTGCKVNNSAGPGNYSCGSLVLDYGDSISIKSSTPVTLTVNGDLLTRSNAINTGGQASSLSLVVTGTLSLSYQTNIVANIRAGQITDAGQATVTGDLSTDTGNLTLGYDTRVSGSLRGNKGTITLGQAVRVGGDVIHPGGAVDVGYAATVAGLINAAGAVSLAQESLVSGSVSSADSLRLGFKTRVLGSVSAAGAITLEQEAEVRGMVNGAAAAVNLGYRARVTGPVQTTSGPITLAQSARVDGCVRSSASAAITLGYQAEAAQVCCGSSVCGTQCVRNDSTWAMPKTCAPVGPPPVSSVDHYEVWLPSSSISCTGAAVTIKACASAGSPCSNPVTTLRGQTVTLSTSAGSLSNSTPALDANGTASATLSFPEATDGASVTVNLVNTPARATNPSLCCPDGAACSAATACSSTFRTAGFIFSDAVGGASLTLPHQTAGQDSGRYLLRAVKTNTSTQACEAALQGASSVNWALQCMDPSTCASDGQMTLTGAESRAIASNPLSLSSNISTAVGMLFDTQGNAPFSLNYADVGRVRLRVSKAVNGATLTGSSNGFVVKPAGLVISQLRQTASPNKLNPAATSASGEVFVKAGEAFSATLTAVNARGEATPGFGRESQPEGVLLTPSLLQPSDGVTGQLSQASISGARFSLGQASVNNLAYSEAGVVQLTASVADGDYLGAGAVRGPTSPALGRFVPAGFALSAVQLRHRSTRTCTPASEFSYLGEPLQFQLTLSAVNLANAVTTNYRGAFAKFDLSQVSAWQLIGRDGNNTFSTANGRLLLTSTSNAWAAGVARGVTLGVVVNRASNAEGPFSVQFGIAPQDSDGVRLSAFDLASSATGTPDRASLGTMALRLGRLRLNSAIGAGGLPLSLPATLQYWSGSDWRTNTLDSCTQLPSTSFNWGQLSGQIQASEAGSTTSLAFQQGTGQLVLKPVARGHSGTYELVVNLGNSATDAACLQPWTPINTSPTSAGANLPWLRGGWCGSTLDKDPWARASFGLSRGPDHLIDLRERY